MDIPVTISDLSAQGVRLASPTDPAFDGVAGPLIGPRADRLLALKPLLTVVTNGSKKTIAAASIIFRVDKSVQGLNHWTNVSFPEVVVGELHSNERRGVRPGESMAAAAGVAVEGFDGPEPENWYRHVIDGIVQERDDTLRGARSVTIELNAVIFDDGTLVGQDDEGKLTELFSRRIGAYQYWLQTVADGLAGGQSVDAAFSKMVAFQADVRARQGSLRDVPHDQRYIEVERTNAAADVAAWRRRIGDAALPAALAELRLSRFEIHR